MIPSDLAGPPRRPVPVPDSVARLAAGRPVVAVWRNQLGGVTFSVGTPAELYVKWQPTGVTADLDAERERLDWLRPRTPVPRVVDHGADRHGRWLLTEAMAGTTAVADRWKIDPEPAIRAIGRGLRLLHDAVPVDACPWDRSVASRLATAGVPADAVGPEPGIDGLVVCHGDPCAPNTLVDDDGGFVGHVDVGDAGVADRWADLAVGAMSLGWNFGPGWDDAYYSAYGVDPDPVRIDFYRRLWNAT